MWDNFSFFDFENSDLRNRPKDSKEVAVSNDEQVSQNNLPSNMLYIYLLDWSFTIVDSVVVGVVWSISKRCTRPRRFSNPCFKFVRNADMDSPFTFVGVGIAVVVAQTNATNNRKVFILIVTKNCKKTAPKPTR